MNTRLSIVVPIAMLFSGVGVQLLEGDPPATAPVPPSAQGDPVIQCDVPVFDFGDRPESAPVRHTFVVWNRGAAPLTISQVRACCGGRAKLAESIIAPGSNTTIAVEADLAGRVGPQKKSIYVASNDPQQPHFRLGLVGTVVAQTRLDPASVLFRSLTPSSEEVATVTVATAADESPPTNAIVDVAWLKVLLGEPHGSTSTVTIATVPPLPQGMQKAIARVQFADAAVPYMEVPVTVVVGEEIRAVPYELVLPAGAGSPTPDRRALLLRSVHAKPFQVLRVECPSDEWTVDLQPWSPGVWRVQLGNIKVAPGTEQGVVRVFTDLPGCAVVGIPVRVETK